MTGDWPKIVSRRSDPAVALGGDHRARGRILAGAQPEIYHAVGQADYVAIVARTPEGQIPIVRQYRPAIERFAWELPAGMVDQGESAEACCARELTEETGFAAERFMRSARLRPAPPGCRTGCIRSSWRPASAGRRARRRIELRLVRPAELADLIRSGEFVLQLHIGALLLAAMQRHIDIADLTAGG